LLFEWREEKDLEPMDPISIPVSLSHHPLYLSFISNQRFNSLLTIQALLILLASNQGKAHISEAHTFLVPSDRTTLHFH
jgi:hypothetical protein